MAPSSLPVTEYGETMRSAMILGISTRWALFLCCRRRCACCRLRIRRLRSVRRFAVLLPTPWKTSHCILLPRSYPDGRGHLQGAPYSHWLSNAPSNHDFWWWPIGNVRVEDRHRNDAVDDIITRASDLIKLCVPSGGPAIDVCPAVLHVPHTGIFRILCVPTSASPAI
jgi:hypothetical protein